MTTIRLDHRRYLFCFYLCRSDAFDHGRHVRLHPPQPVAVAQVVQAACSSFPIPACHQLVSFETIPVISANKQLLKIPFCFYLFARRGLEQLICEGGWIDKTMAIGVIGALELISKSFVYFSLPDTFYFYSSVPFDEQLKYFLYVDAQDGTLWKTATFSTRSKTEE